jgi:hypothetical protein
VAFSCGVDTPAIALNLSGGKLAASLILSTDTGQAASIRSNGLYVPGSIASQSFPPTPNDGDEITYIADAVNGVDWRFKFRASSSSAYRWEFIGGPDFELEVNATQIWTSPNGSWGNIPGGTVGPVATVPLEGDYDIQLEAQIEGQFSGPSNPPPTVGPAASIQIGLNPPSFDDAICNYTGFTVSVSRSRRKPFLAANTQILMQYIANSGNPTTFGHRFLKIKPVRVLGGGQ